MPTPFCSQSIVTELLRDLSIYRLTCPPSPSKKCTASLSNSRRQSTFGCLESSSVLKISGRYTETSSSLKFWKIFVKYLMEQLWRSLGQIHAMEGGVPNAQHAENCLSLVNDDSLNPLNVLFREITAESVAPQCMGLSVLMFSLWFWLSPPSRWNLYKGNACVFFVVPSSNVT